MLCQECNQQKATVFITRIVNGLRTDLHLCERCARAKGDLDFSFEPKFTLKNFFASFLSEPWAAKKDKEAVHPAKVQCSNCALTFAQFSQIGRFGCSSCYHSFGDEKLQPLFRRIHGNIDHVGKVPRRIGGTTRIKREIGDLRKQLQQFIHLEEYEKAAAIRDQIRVLENALQKKEQERGDGHEE
ncbi:MAG: hypothetical protein GX364_03850 [Firmicutes bacterium]|jgi:protein arginine kinase activator|nr:hypothetical protein [Bacillota bacterium]